MYIEGEGRKEYERRIFNGFYQFTLGFGIYDLANETEQWTKERKCVCVCCVNERMHIMENHQKEIKKFVWIECIMFECSKFELTNWHFEI